MFDQIRCRLGFGYPSNTEMDGEVYFLSDIVFTGDHLVFKTKSVSFRCHFHDCGCGHKQTASMEKFDVKDFGNGKISRAKLKELLPSKHNRQLRMGSLVSYLTGHYSDKKDRNTEFCKALVPAPELFEYFGLIDTRPLVCYSFSNAYCKHLKAALDKHSRYTECQVYLDEYDRLYETERRLKQALFDSIDNYLE